MWDCMYKVYDVVLHSPFPIHCVSQLIRYIYNANFLSDEELYSLSSSYEEHHS